MSHDQNAQDPLDFVRGMWSNMGFTLPGMVTPTIDVEELDKRITDMKAVEGWLKMNLNMLQMTIQGLEMQRATIAAVKAMSRQAPQQEADIPAAGPAEGGANPFAAAAAMWPWNLVGNPPAGEEDAGAGKRNEDDKPARTTKGTARGTRRKTTPEK